MNDYEEVRFDLEPCTEYMTDVLAAMLADAGFESFVPDEKGLTAYIRADADADACHIDGIISFFPFETAVTYRRSVIEGRDWNSEWEKNYFKPIVIADRCVVHSTFHKDIPVCEYDILIDPKMAFGTGHHSTTSLIMNELLSMDMRGKKVVDMGTGTGILAILASMRGAENILAVEIDPAAYENAVENVSLNHRENIRLVLGDASALDACAAESADMLMANINRNVITADISRYASVLKRGGMMLLSGFYEEDIPVVEKAAEEYGVRPIGFDTLNKWACLKLHKHGSFI
ncbi:MAG: 50S ribosomal protein L11 methyltransferase [Muribaculaceae bacterium]|nr:50S ribosomal protein L11 methyltransferase [Muribaculaceae bacterium]